MEDIYITQEKENKTKNKHHTTKRHNRKLNSNYHGSETLQK